MQTQLQALIDDFLSGYFASPEGQKHFRTTTETEPREVKRIFSEIRDRYNQGQDITDDVLQRLLPHLDSQFHRENHYRVSIWGAIRKDVRDWFESAGWKQPDEWTATARMLFEALDGAVRRDWEPWERFINSEYRLGFGTGFLTPILFCLDNQFPVINSKVVKTYQAITEFTGNPDRINAKLESYHENARKVIQLQKQLEPYGINSLALFDLFCHYYVISERDRKPVAGVADYAAWLFVANPAVFTWKTAFDEGGVDWKGSTGNYAQKLIRESIRNGDRVFGYQAGPTYAIVCEMRVAKDRYQVSKSEYKGTWAVDLEPVRWLTEPVSLATLKEHPQLSEIKFVQQTQISISGITSEQLGILDGLIREPQIRKAELSEVDRLCEALDEAQYTTSASEQFEILLTDAFNNLGFDAEHIGGSGDTDIFITGQLGADTYSVVVDAKTRSHDASLPSANFDAINQHREQHNADYAAIVAPAFSSGNIQSFAQKHRVSLITTETLIRVLQLHAQFPFGTDDLCRLFDRSVSAENIADKLENIHTEHDRLIKLTSTVLEFFDENQRQSDRIETIDSNSLYWYLKASAESKGLAQPDLDSIEQVLQLLSNDVLDILTRNASTYILTVSPDAARKRLDALVRMLGSEA